MTLEELQIKFTADAKGLDSELAGIKKSVGGLEAPTGKASSALGGLAKMGGALMAAGIGVKLIDVGKDALMMANEVSESESLFEVSMGAMADDARAWSEELSNSLGVNAYSARKNVGVLNTMFKSMGLGTGEAANMSKSLTMLSEDMASFYNLDPTEAFTKLQAGITGEAEGLKRLGILVDENTVQQYALRKGIIKQGQAMTNQQKVAARYGAILEQTSDAQGDLARTMESPTNQLRKLNNEFDQAKIALGQALQPALIAVMPVLTGLATGVKDVIESFSGLGSAEKDALDGVALTLADTTAIVKSNLASETDNLVEGVSELKEDVDASVKDFGSAVQVTKKVIAEIRLLTSSTGDERFNKILASVIETASGTKAAVDSFVESTLTPLYKKGDIKESEYNKEKMWLNIRLQKLTAKQDALQTKVQTMVDAAMEDGIVDDKELETIKETLTTEANKLLKDEKIIADHIEATVNAWVKKGILTGAEGKTVTETVQGLIDENAATITGITATVDAAVGVGNWNETTLTPDQTQKLKETVQAEVTAAGQIPVDAQAAVTGVFSAASVTYSGSSLETAVNEMFSGAKTAIQNASKEIDAAFAKAIEQDGMTPELLEVVNKNREIIQKATLLSVKGITPEGEWNKALGGYDGLSSESVKNLAASYATYIEEQSNLYNEIAQSAIDAAYSYKEELLASGMSEKEFDDYVKGFENTFVDRVNNLKTGAIMDAARTMFPDIAAAIESGDSGRIESALSSFSTFVKSFADDLHLLPPEAQKTIADTLDAFSGIEGLGMTTQWALDDISGIVKIGMSGIKSLFGEGANAAVMELKYALNQGKITESDYDKILGASSSAVALATLANKFREEGNNAAAELIEGMIAKIPDAKKAGSDLAGAAQEGVDGRGGTFGIGANLADGFISGIKSRHQAAIKAARDLANAAANSMKNTLQIESPSKVAEGFGLYFGEGFAVGMQDMAGAIYSTSAGLAQTAVSGMQGVNGTIGVGVNGSLGDTGVSGAIAQGVAMGVQDVMNRLQIEMNLDGERLGRASIKAINGVLSRSGRTILNVGNT